MEPKYMTEKDRRNFKMYQAKAGYNTTASLAEVVGMSRNTLSKKIKGAADWTRSEMEKIASLFNEAPEVIFFDHELRNKQHIEKCS